MENTEQQETVNDETENQEAANKVYQYAAHLFVNEKKNAVEVKSALLEKGLDEESAQNVVIALEDQIATARKEKANKDITYGALWCVGGILVTVITYSAAQGGGTYTVAWGAIIFGGIQFFRGLSNSQK